MYISKIELYGFKSFAKKEIIDLQKGITVVVGPNGCGKTNIVDAIRWVLGEQKTTKLRSSKMEDVIFNGASSIKPLGFCEVFLTIQNDNGLLPVEFEEVEIGRKLFRSGESEYYLNRNQCRLKDIFNLFVDTGMSSDAYSVIELNMIEKILSDYDDSRRSMFEEAAGINKYKSQRKSAINKFELNQRDIERIDDIILEIQEQVNYLGLQFKRLKRFQSLNENLKEMEIKLASKKVYDLEEIVNHNKSIIENLNKKLENFSTKKEAKNSEIDNISNKYFSEKSKLTELKQFVDDLTEKLLSEIQEKNKESSRGVEILENELQRRMDQLTSFDKDYIKIVSSCDECNSGLNLRVSCSKCGKIHDSSSFKLIESDKKYEELKKSIKDYRDKIKNYKNEKELDFSAMDKSIDKIKEEITLNKSRLEKQEEKTNKAYVELETLRQKISNEGMDREEIIFEIKNYEIKITESTLRISQIKENIIEKYGENIRFTKDKNINLSELSFEVEKIRRSVDSIGPINWAVESEFEEKKKRLDNLIDQREDLISAEKNLKEAILKIDSVAKEKFLETFEIINANFEKMFSSFFLGGKGYIFLENPEDPLSSSINIFAQPPGKNNKVLKSLSAGEKSLTAIALLFSIYLYKPSPFCILDEIDAPLDDINIKKFTDVIVEFSKSTQFMIVTHNKLTMESANIIYGVTSEQQGVSKIISIDLN